MRRRLAIVLFGFLGLVVGVVVTALGSRSYTSDAVIEVPAHSRDAKVLVAVARNQHVQGVRVRIFDAHIVSLTGHGSLAGSVRAVWAVARKLIDSVPRSQVRVIHGIASCA
jgi:hypothetical protein